MKLEIYSNDNLAYVTLGDSEIVRTVELTPSIMVDFDQFNVVVGVEFLDLDARIPYDKLTTECHVDSAVVEQLRKIEPTINGFVSSLTMSSREHSASSSALTGKLVSA
ncbi:MAG: hypothetical protein JWM23_529 [Microbacteriaceae bacterium]|nr:hypothetical protein [Microbacteriaceae bacterium]